MLSIVDTVVVATAVFEMCWLNNSCSNHWSVNLDQNDDDEVQSMAVVLEFENSDNSLELIVNQLAILAFEDP